MEVLKSCNKEKKKKRPSNAPGHLPLRLAHSQKESTRNVRLKRK